MRPFIILLTLLGSSFGTVCQDTFSIVAVDSTTGEVGAAGASCVDLFNIGDISDHFLGELFPGSGAIATQAWYVPANQVNARMRMQMGEHPDTIIQWLVENDVQGRPELRQYGIAALRDEGLVSAAHTGEETDDYKGHITGPGYSIQGNILLGPEVLEQMEQNFLNTDGPLRCKLMAALQGANLVGADSRCAGNGTSSLFAFLKVTGPDDTFGEPAFVRSVRTRSGDGIEPIDSLQAIFDAEGICASSGTGSLDEMDFRLFPNPCRNILQVSPTGQTSYRMSVMTMGGTMLRSYDSASGSREVDLNEMSAGVYFVVIETDDHSAVYRVVRI